MEARNNLENKNSSHFRRLEVTLKGIINSKQNTFQHVKTCKDQVIIPFLYSFSFDTYTYNSYVYTQQNTDQ